MKKPVEHRNFYEAIEKNAKYSLELAGRPLAAAPGAPFLHNMRQATNSDDIPLLLNTLVAEGRALKRELGAAMADIARETEMRRGRRNRCNLETSKHEIS